jgi:hypothetical protein
LAVFSVTYDWYFERHEIRIRGRDHTIVFIADSQDGRLVIRQEPDGKKSKEVCAIRLSDPDDRRAFFKGLRRILSSLGYAVESGEAPAVTRREKPRAGIGSREDERDAVVAQARQKNPVAFAPWTREEEREVRRRYEAGENIQAIARAHKRSPRAIELRLQRLGVLPRE